MNTDGTCNTEVKHAFLYDHYQTHSFIKRFIQDHFSFLFHSSAIFSGELKCSFNKTALVLFAYFDVVAPPISSGIFSCSLCISRAIWTISSSDGVIKPDRPMKSVNENNHHRTNFNQYSTTTWLHSSVWKALKRGHAIHHKTLENYALQTRFNLTWSRTAFFRLLPVTRNYIHSSYAQFCHSDGVNTDLLSLQWRQREFCHKASWHRGRWLWKQKNLNSCNN